MDRERLDDDLEDIRVQVLANALEGEHTQRSLEVKATLFGSLQQGSKGNIRAGSLTDARFAIHEEVFKGLFPYIEWPKPPPELQEGAPGGESDERVAFLSDYKRWVAGENIESKILHAESSR